MVGNRWTVAVAVVGAALCFIFVALGLGNVSTPEGPCGTGLAPGWSEDMATATACDAAMGDRRQLMALTGVPGLLLLGLAAAGRVAAQKARDNTRVP